MGDPKDGRFDALDKRLKSLGEHPKSPAPTEERGEGLPCENCGGLIDHLWHVSEEMWSRISLRPHTPGTDDGGILCVSCASRRSERVGITLIFYGVDLIKQEELASFLPSPDPVIGGDRDFESPVESLIRKLRAAGSTGLDLSPGDPLCMEAALALSALCNEIEGDVSAGVEQAGPVAWELWQTNHNGITTRTAVFARRHEVDNRIKELTLAYGWAKEDLEVCPLYDRPAADDQRRILRDTINKSLRTNERIIQERDGLREALRLLANYACDLPCGCHNCIARTALGKEKS